MNNAWAGGQAEQRSRGISSGYWSTGKTSEFQTELSEHQQPDSADQITKAVEGTQRKMTKEDGSRKEGKCRGM